MRFKIESTSSLPLILRPLELFKSLGEDTTGRTFEPLEWQIEPLLDQSSILLLTGSAGGGKSRLALEKLHGNLKRYLGSTGIILRKAKEHCVQRVLPFFEAKVLGDELGTKVKRTGKSYYQYSNGSMLFWGGMWDERQREAIRSVGQDAGLDFAMFDEATQFDERDFEEIAGRMRGKAAPYTQIILATNPDAPTHWINQRLILGDIASVYYSGYQDNPYNPDSYGKSLELITGVLYQRLVKGKWVIAEGAVYDNFDPRYNVTKEAEYNPDWEVRWGVDDGYVFGDGPGHANYHPRVILFGQQTPIGGVNIFNEYVKCQEHAEDSLANVLQWDYELPELAAVDSSASQLRARIGDAGIMHSGATHEVAEGIKVVRRYICDGQGVRLLKIHPRCTHTIRELQSLRYDLKSKTVKAGQPKPLKVDDHCPDALRYLIWSIK